MVYCLVSSELHYYKGQSSFTQYFVHVLFTHSSRPWLCVALQEPYFPWEPYTCKRYFRAFWVGFYCKSFTGCTYLFTDYVCNLRDQVHEFTDIYQSHVNLKIYFFPLYLSTLSKLPSDLRWSNDCSFISGSSITLLEGVYHGAQR